MGLATTTASPAGATVLGGCPDRSMSRPFLRWLDPLSYTIAPNFATAQRSSPATNRST